MRCLILAALIGFCAGSALYPRGHQIVFVDDDQVLVHGVNGNSYGFLHHPGQHMIDIAINGVNSPAKHIHINDQSCQIVQLQGFQSLPLQVQQGIQVGNYENHLFKVLSQYEGIVNDYQFRQLLQVIHNHVQQGHICHIIYHLLSVLDQVVNEDFVQQYIHGQHQIGGVPQLVNQIQVQDISQLGGDVVQQYIHGQHDVGVNEVLAHLINQIKGQGSLDEAVVQQYIHGGQHNVVNQILAHLLNQIEGQSISPLDRDILQQYISSPHNIGVQHLLNRVQGQSISPLLEDLVQQYIHGQPNIGLQHLVNQIQGQGISPLHEDVVQQYIHGQHNIGVNPVLAHLINQIQGHDISSLDQDVLQQYIHGQHSVGVNQVIAHLLNQIQGQQSVGQYVNPSLNSGYLYPEQGYQHHYGVGHHYGISPIVSHQGIGVGQRYGSSHVLDYLLGSNQYQGGSLLHHNVLNQGYVQPVVVY